MEKTTTTDERWVNSSDPADTGKDVDPDYLRTGTEIESVTEAYNPEAGNSRLDRSKRPSGGGSHSWGDAKRDEHEHDHPTGFVGQKARTTCIGQRDVYGNPCDGWRWGGRKWRFQMGLRVRNAVGEEITTNDRDKRALLSAIVDSLDIPTHVHQRVIELVATDENTNVWNRWHDGWESMAVGYAAYVVKSDVETAQAYAEKIGPAVGLDAADARDAVEYAYDRAEERGISA